MKKRALISGLSCLLAISLALGLLPSSLALGSLSNFDKMRTYEAGMFSDVSAGAWYEPYIARAYEYALIDGDGGGGFNPGNKVTLAEAVKLAVCLHMGYYGVNSGFSGSGTWYAPYVDYARRNGILEDNYRNYNATATRADFAALISAALPDEAVTAINRVDDGALPDVLLSYSYGPAVYRLYRAGVLTGGNKSGTFYPGRGISRAEAAAVVVRMMDAEARVQQMLVSEMKPEELYKKSVSAVVFIEVFDKDGEIVKTGSGFFVNETGDVVTNYHVVIGGHSAKVTTSDGEVYDVRGIYDYDWKKDIAVLNVEGEGFSYLPFGDSDGVLTGETVYAIGSPLGLQSTMSRGIVSSALREIGKTRYIQTDAPLSSGSSGGPLLDSRGLVIGITTAGADGGQNLNLAVPISLIGGLDRTECVSLASQIKSVIFYGGHPGVPDFGAVSGAKVFSKESENDRTEFSYKTGDFTKDTEELLDEYRMLLEQNLFTMFGYYDDGDNVFDAYYKASSNQFIMFGTEKVKGAECVTVIIMPMF